MLSTAASRSWLACWVTLLLAVRGAQAEPPAADGGSAAASGSAAQAVSSVPASPSLPAAEPTSPAERTQPASPAAATDADGSGAGPTPAPGAADPKLLALRSELTALMDDLVSARARTVVLGKTLFKTRVSLRVQNLAGPDPVLAKLVVSLDGAPVFRGDGSTLAGDEARAAFDGFAAPGPHVLSVEVEQRSRGDVAYGYTLRETYKFEAPRERQTELTLVLDDDSSLADDFADDGEGEYDVRTRLRVKTRALGEK
jgi:hypothetical protein